MASIAATSRIDDPRHFSYGDNSRDRDRRELNWRGLLSAAVIINRIGKRGEDPIHRGDGARSGPVSGISRT